jgi:phytoene dehydrogenase-like protein
VRQHRHGLLVQGNGPLSADLIARRHWNTIIVGAGSAGLSAATLYGMSDPSNTLLVEAHHEPGGCAGYFARGRPRRVHDAGATQLVEYRPGGLQWELLKAAQNFRRDASLDMPRALPIPFLDHWWPAQSPCAQPLGLRWHRDGQLELPVSGLGQHLDGEVLQQLEEFLASCATDAAALWRMFYRFPDFPLHHVRDALRLVRCAWPLDTKVMWIALSHLGSSVAAVAARYPALAHPKARALIDALLLDTAQNHADETPYLAGAMGLSILKRGIVRMDGGMRSLFRPWLLGVRASGVQVAMGSSVVQISSLAQGGFELVVEAKTRFLLRCHNLIVAMPWRTLEERVPFADALRLSLAWQRWQQAARTEHEWQAFALHGVLVGQAPQAIGTEPWYVQVFPRDTDVLQHALYVSCDAEQDPGRALGNETQGPTRVFTASVHTDLARDPRMQALGLGGLCNDDTRAPVQSLAAIKDEMIRRVEAATGLRVAVAELASPRTYERYTGRPEGRVGGLAVRDSTFLFAAMPKIIEGARDSQLVMAGDSVFPGQGVIAASMSGVLAWSRLTGLRPSGHLDLSP